MAKRETHSMLLGIIMIARLVPCWSVSGPPWSMQIQHSTIPVHMNEFVSIPFLAKSSQVLSGTASDLAINVVSDESIAIVEGELLRRDDGAYYGRLNVTGVFLGSTKASIFIGETEVRPDDKDSLEIVVLREERLMDTIFTISVAFLVFILYINFGCAVDWSVCRSTLIKPVGPASGFFCQCLCMPLLSYAIGRILFPQRPEMQLGLFFTGISPSGGASNIWTVVLGGNLNLSVTMTSLCTLAAFGTIPFWTFTLGKQIFANGSILVPYRRIATLAVALIVPLAIGFFVQKKMPKLCKVLVRTMKPFSLFLIAFIIIFAIATNLYLFRLFSTQIVIAGMALPWFGFALGFLVTLFLKQPYPDIIAIAIETGIQNTGIAIFLSRFALQAPAADISTVIPVSVAIMTPIPLTILYLAKLARQYRRTPTAVAAAGASATVPFASDSHGSAKLWGTCSAH